MINSISNFNISNAYTAQKETKSTNNQYDKDMFLKLLVAQMKYQNPLEPSSEQDSIAQFATFSQLEQLQNMAKDIKMSSAINMIGKVVEVSNVKEDGTVEKVQGSVESIDLGSDETRFFVKNKFYVFEDIERIIDEKI